MRNTKMRAFTLAEVLITLGIIGVVAALTIPTLVANTNSQKFRAQFKKTLSTVNQAALMNVAQHDWDFSSVDTNCATDGSGDPASTQTICALLNGSLAGATFMADSDYTNDMVSGHRYVVAASDSAFITYQLADGSIFGFEDNKKCTKDKHCIGFIDVNGASLPNKEVRCTDEGSEGATSTMTIYNSSYAECTVKNAGMGDVFPVLYYDSTVEPATNAARYVLTTTK